MSVVVDGNLNVVVRKCGSNAEAKGTGKVSCDRQRLSSHQHFNLHWAMGMLLTSPGLTVLGEIVTSPKREASGHC